MIDKIPDDYKSKELLDASREQFVRLWMEAYRNGRGEKYVATVAGMGLKSVRDKAGLMSLRGVNLPHLTQFAIAPMFQYDAERLNQIIEEELNK
jgi:hypothetical protein